MTDPIQEPNRPDSAAELQQLREKVNKLRTWSFGDLAKRQAVGTSTRVDAQGRLKVMTDFGQSIFRQSMFRFGGDLALLCVVCRSTGPPPLLPAGRPAGPSDGERKCLELFRPDTCRLVVVALETEGLSSEESQQ